MTFTPQDFISKWKRVSAREKQPCVTWLELAHKKLDETVFAAHGWPGNLSDEEKLERLLVLNLERAGMG